MEDITGLFIDILNNCQTVDVADAEFKKYLAEDDELRNDYRQWCHENGSSEKDGFKDFCSEYLEEQQSIWETLNDYDEEY